LNLSPLTALSQNGLKQLLISLENCDRSDKFKSDLIADYRLEAKTTKQLTTNLRGQIDNFSVLLKIANDTINVLKGTNKILLIDKTQLQKDLDVSTKEIKDLKHKLFIRPIKWGAGGIIIGIVGKVIIALIK
jgi:hypothetical protein